MKNIWILVQLIGGFFVIGSFFMGGLNLFVTVIGLIIVFFGGHMYREESKLIECPSCKERIKKDALKCRFCGGELKVK